MFIALSLPVLSLLTLFGGVDPRLVALSAVGCMSLAYFIGGLSMLVSTTSKSPREAVSLAYLLNAAALVLPAFIEAMRPQVCRPGKRITTRSGPSTNGCGSSAPCRI